jgi:hypothetical protein
MAFSIGEITELEMHLYRSGIPFVHFAKDADSAKTAMKAFNRRLKDDGHDHLEAMEAMKVALFRVPTLASTGMDRVPVVIIERYPTLSRDQILEMEAVATSFSVLFDTKSMDFDTNPPE